MSDTMLEETLLRLDYDRALSLLWARFMELSEHVQVGIISFQPKIMGRSRTVVIYPCILHLTALTGSSVEPGFG